MRPVPVVFLLFAFSPQLSVSVIKLATIQNCIACCHGAVRVVVFVGDQTYIS